MSTRRQLVVFKVGTEEFAVDIMLTREVVLMREITPVPETEVYVEGVMNLRGSLVPVLDFRKRLRAFKTTDQQDHRIIIASLDGRTAGLIVDGASEVIRVSDDMIEGVPHLISEIGAGYVEGVVNLNGRFITLIDLRKALTGEIVGELDEVIAVLSRQRESLAPAQSA
ncbi:MAG TPA: chemotaxis protein CheW [Blastocatellia bacterium]|nr:chemotaxis protein CheW [Blastocatellia bacterium]